MSDRIGDGGRTRGEGFVRFYDSSVPALEPGDYVVNVTQHVNPANTVIDECYATSQPFSVAGPRLTLAAEDVLAVFPPENAQGAFEQFLPNVVLTTSALPWERDLFPARDGSQRTPWLALLLFAEGEQIGGRDTLLEPGDTPSFASRTRSTTLPASALFDHVPSDETVWPRLERRWYETTDQTCTVIDVSAEAFAALVPRRDELRFLTHVRRVGAAAKESGVLRGSHENEYAVVVSNRLPAADGRNIAHLVSLEGLEEHVARGALPAGATSARMISLRAWSFRCAAVGAESFAQLAKGLLKDAAGKEKSTTFALSTSTAGDVSDEELYAREALGRGYVPLCYQTRLGEETFAWYRGPFAPVPVADFVGSAPGSGRDSADWRWFGTASAAVVYDPSHGIFDVSYAVAWETGRLLALADRSLAPTLRAWQHRGQRLIDLFLERRSQVAALQGSEPARPDPLSEPTPQDLTERHAITREHVTSLVARLASRLAPGGAEAAPEPDDSPWRPFADLRPPVANAQTVTELLRDRDVVRQVVRERGATEAQHLADWLARLYLLAGVPSEALIPHAGLLPPESLRFFYLDPNWLAALLEGALSIGVGSSRDRGYQDLMRDLIWDATVAAASRVRHGLLGDPSPAPSVPCPPGPMAGVLLRSALVSGWPGLELRAYANTQAPGSPLPDPSSLLPPLRVARLSTDVLLCLWSCVPTVVAIDEPTEGLAFGFEDPPDGPGVYLYLRSLDRGRYGHPLSVGIDAASFIDGGTRVMRIGSDMGLVAAIEQRLGVSRLSVSGFAMQMVKTPERAVFASPPTKTPGGSR